MKKINKTQVRNIILTIALIGIMGSIYFLFPIMIMPDSTEYYGYLKIYNGEEPFSSWNVVRGPSFSTVLFIITKLFSNSSFGILVGTFIFYLIVVFSGIFILKKIEISNKVGRIMMYITYGICVVFNPILIGYMHGLLTEFVAMPILVISAIISSLWIKNKSKIAKIFIPVILAVSCIFMWFLKQPYLFLGLGPIIVASIISVFENRKLKNLLYRIVVVLICIVSVLGSNVIWNKVLEKNKVDTNTGRDTNSFIKTAVINGNTAFSIDFYPEHYELEYIQNSNLIKQEDKDEITKILNNTSKYKSFKLINVFKDFTSREESNLLEKRVMFSTSEEYTIRDAIKTYFINFAKYPVKTIQAYILNYGAIANVVPSMRHKDANEYYPSLTDGFYFENFTIGSSIYNTESNMLWLDENHYLYDNVKDLKVENNAPQYVKNFGIKTFGFYNTIYKASMVVLPLILILIILKRKNAKNNNNKNILNIGIILTAGGLIHVLFHTFTGAIIDRYGFVVLPGVILGIIILIFSNEGKKEVKQKEKYISKTSKTLTIIPAYNEEQNIQKVLDELKKDFKETDILVINDNSKDKTKEIVEKNGVECITTVFNLHYAYAVQTGIKYAKKHNYDYCIMFDGDGQHIAKEAKKLLERIKETNCDIVIGSRYLEKGNYNAPKLRKIGTSFFTWLVKISAHKKISDPLSGFQIINKRVIEKYSKMGEYPEFPDANLIIEMLLEGYDIQEVSVKMRNREFGESMHGGIIKPIKYMIEMLYTIVIIILNKLGRRKK